MKKVFRNKYTRLLLGLFSGCCIYILTAAHCCPKESIPVKGTLFNKPFSTIVDHPIVKEMLEQNNTETLSEFYAHYNKEELSNSLLIELSQKYSPDAATFYFIQRMYADEKNKEAQDLFLHYTEQLHTALAVDSLESLKDYTIVFVPGFFYKSDTTTGADFKKQRQLFESKGVETVLLEIDELGLCTDNAKYIAHFINTMQHTKPLIIVSASKGGLETAIALSEYTSKEKLQQVKAWISVGGTLKGSPTADRFLCEPRCWMAEMFMHKHDKTMDIVKDVSYANRSPQFENLHLPDNIKIIHYVGAPISNSMTKEIRKRVCAISEFGPNDGATPLYDEITKNGIVITEPGLDHFFRDDNIDTKTLAMALVAIANK